MRLAQNLVLFSLLMFADVPVLAASVVLTSSANPSLLGHSVTLTAAVAPGAPSGTVTFYDGSAVLGTRALLNGQAMFTTALLSPGVHALRAYFGGSSASLTETINALPASGLATAVNYPVGTNAMGGAVGDFNGDGVADLVVGIDGGSNIAVLLGNSDGTFRAVTYYAAGNKANSVAVGDFNGDGKTDIAVANAGLAANNLNILLGNGDGTFQSPVGYATGSSELSIAVSDFNGDGKADLAFLNGIMLGNGDGTFQALLPYTANNAGTFVAVGDFNSDGKADLVAASQYGGISVLLGKGDGTFQPSVDYAAGPGATSTAIGDFNGDGVLDLAVSNVANSVSVLIGKGDGTFATPVSYTAGNDAWSVAVTDFNGDHIPDLVVANRSDSNLTVFIGKGDGTFQAFANYSTGQSPWYVVAGDFNADGRADLAVINNSSSFVSVLTGLAPVSSGPAQNISFSAVPEQIYGGSPLVITARSTSGLAVTLTSSTPAVCRVASGLVTLFAVGSCSITASQSGNAQFNAAASITRSFTVSLAKPSGTLIAGAGATLTLGSRPGLLAAGDFNNDGIPDIVVADFGNNGITALAGNGTGGFTPGPTTPFAAGTMFYGLVVGDFNGDGVPDTAVLSSIGGSATVTVLLGNGSGGFTAAPGGPFAVGISPLLPSSLVVGDFNGDGIEDLAMCVNGSVVLLVGNGAGGFSIAAGPSTAGTSVNSVTVDDFNGDGIQDLAITELNPNNNVPSASVYIVLGNSAGGFTSAAGGPFAIAGTLSDLVSGDFNNDGIRDLAALDHGGKLTVLSGDGSGKFTASLGPIATAVQFGSMVVGDLNGDGSQDLAISSPITNKVTVMLGNGSGGFIASAGGPFPVGTGVVTGLAVGDFNRDGLQDLATVSTATDSVFVLLGGLAATSSVLSTTSPPTVPFGQPVPMTLTVSHTSNAFSAPAGPAVFYDYNGTAVIGVASQLKGPYTFTATNLIAGNHQLSATYPLDARSVGSTSNTLAIQVQGGPTPQSITFAAPAAVTLPASAFILTATVNSGLPVSFASTTLSVCTVSGSALIPLSAGICTITATQAGDASYAAATPVTQSFTINPAASGGGNPLSVSPAAVAVTAPLGGAPGTQTVKLSYATFTQGVPTFNTNVNALPGQVQGWISVSPSAGAMTQASFSNSLYTYTATVTISADPTGIAPGSVYTGTVSLSSGSASLSVPVTLNVSPGAIPQPTGGIANAASAGQAIPSIVSPGSYVAIYGSALAGAGNPNAKLVPLPTTLNGAQVTLCGVPMPLLYASAAQINAVVPQGLPANSACPLVVTAGTVQSAPVPLTVTELQPGIYTVDTSGSGAGIVANALTGQLITASNPAHPSDFLAVYCTGLGSVQGPNGEAEPGDGAVAPLSPLFRTTATVTATIGGVSAPVTFSGLTATFAVLYQVNIQVPPSVTPGNKVSLVITATDPKSGITATSNSVTVVVQ